MDSQSELMGSHNQPNPSLMAIPGRGGIILALGIAAILVMGPLLGIPAWVMGRRDLKRIKAGVIAAEDRTSTQIGMVLGIIGTFFSPFTVIIIGIAIAVALSLFAAQSIQANKDAMIGDICSISQTAYQYHERPKTIAGGGGSFEGFALSKQMMRTTHGTYQIRVISSNELQIIGSSTQNVDNGIIATLDGHGDIAQWEYSGDFDPEYSPNRYQGPTRKQIPKEELRRGV